MFDHKKIFISGANGVIGNELVKKLHSLGARIYVGDLKPRPDDWPADIIYRQGDLNYITKEELDEFAPEYFFHLAATFERSVETYEFWQENFNHNVKLSNYLMSQLKDSASLKKVIFCSSYLIYNPDLYTFDTPQTKAFSLNENAQIYPRNLTGVAKLNHEIELRFLNDFKKDSYQTLSARIYRSYGKNSRDVISRWVRSLLNGEEISLYCKEGMFDYIFAGEVAEGLIRLADSPKAEGIVNLGNGRARRVEEVVEVLRKHFPDLKCSEFASDVKYEASQADVSLLEELTGWKPQKQLEDAIPEIIEYEKNAAVSKEKECFNVLVTSISKKIPLLKAVRKAAGKLSDGIKIIGGDANPDCIGKYFVDAFWEMPRLNQLSPEDLIQFCKKNNIKAVIPTRDGELEFFSDLGEALRAEGINVMIGAPWAVGKSLDKIEFYKTLITDPALNKHAIVTTDKIDAEAQGLYVVKERFGAGSRSMGLRLNAKSALEHSRNLEAPCFQPFITGREYSVDVYVSRNGKVKGTLARTRDLIVDGESQVTSKKDYPLLEEVCGRLAEILGIYGHAVIQAIEDKDGNLYLLECNSRFGGASTLSLACGLDSFYWFLLESCGADIGGYPFIKSIAEKKQVRFADDIIL